MRRRWRNPAPDVTASIPASPPFARSRQLRPCRRLQTNTTRRASPSSRQSRAPSAFRSCRDWRSRLRRPRQSAYELNFRLRSSYLKLFWRTVQRLPVYDSGKSSRDKACENGYGDERSPYSDLAMSHLKETVSIPRRHAIIREAIVSEEHGGQRHE